MYTMKEIKRALRRDRDLRTLVVKSGVKDAILLDITSDKQPDIALLDTTGDGYLDSVALDTDGNGYFDTLFSDTDGNDIPDTIVFGDLDRGEIHEVLHGADVEDAIVDLVNQVVSAVMLGAFTVAAADALSDEICQNLAEAAKEVEQAEKEEAKAQKKSDREKRVAALKAKIGGIVKHN